MKCIRHRFHNLIYRQISIFKCEPPYLFLRHVGALLERPPDGVEGEGTQGLTVGRHLPRLVEVGLLHRLHRTVHSPAERRKAAFGLGSARGAKEDIDVV